MQVPLFLIVRHMQSLVVARGLSGFIYPNLNLQVGEIFFVMVTTLIEELR